MKFVVATPARSVCDDNARALERHGLLRFIALGTRRGTKGIPRERTRLNPRIGLWGYVADKVLPSFQAESARFRLGAWFDRWVLRQLQPGDHIISSYGYVNECFRAVRKRGGKTFLDAGNSHVENFWQTISEEHRRWNCAYPPFSTSWYERCRATLQEVDYVLSPSSFVTRSFLERGFKPEQILRNVYPLDLSCFQADSSPRRKDRPLTVINTGSLSLRKGTPYLLEAFRLIRQKEPNSRLLLMDTVRDDIKGVLAKYGDLPIDWSPALPHLALATRLRSADVFILPSLEDGFARTVAEALACGLQVVTTPNTGASDLVRPGENGEVVPIRDAQALAAATLRCWERAGQGRVATIGTLSEELSFDNFEKQFISQLQALKLI